MPPPGQAGEKMLWPTLSIIRWATSSGRRLRLGNVHTRHRGLRHESLSGRGAWGRFSSPWRFEVTSAGPEQPHMAEPSPVPPISTLVVRFWCEWSAAGPRWRGRIEDVQSGESATFLDLEGMLDFVRRSGVMVDSEIQTVRKKG